MENTAREWSEEASTTPTQESSADRAADQKETTATYSFSDGWLTLSEKLKMSSYHQAQKQPPWDWNIDTAAVSDW